MTDETEALRERLVVVKAELARLNATSNVTDFLGEDGEEAEPSEDIKKALEAEIANLERELNDRGDNLQSK